MTVGEDANVAVDLAVLGMTCASCAARIERKLNKLEGISATVNYATETARVELGPSASLDDVVGTVRGLGYEALRPVVEPPSRRAGDEDRLTPAELAAQADLADLRQRFRVSLALTIPVVLLSMVPALQFDYWQWLCFALASPVVAWGAWRFHRAAVLALRHGTTTMDTLVSMGCLAAYVWSVWALFLGGAGAPGYAMSDSLLPWQGGADAMGAPDIYLEVASAVPVFILAGRWFEARAKRDSSAALRALLHLTPDEVSVLRDGAEIRVPHADLRVGDRFVVRPGERIATDGSVVMGSSAVDESMLTGESTPIEVSVGSAVTGASLNTDGSLVVEATRIGADTRIAQITRLVTDAQAGKAPVQRLADRVAAVFVPIVLVIALVTLLAWLWAGR